MVILSPVKIRRTRRVKPLSAYRNIPLLKQTVHEYYSSTGLHGIQYLGEKGRPWTERLWWVVVILASLTSSSLLILRVWNKWTTTPVLVSFAENPSPIWELPFPTVTLCPSIKYHKEVFNLPYFLQYYDSLSSDEKKVVNALLLICRDPTTDEYDGEDKFANNLFINIQKVVAPSYFDSVECSFLYETNNSCTRLFQVLTTREGVCFSFNLLPNMTIYSQATVQYNEAVQSSSKNPKRPIWSLERGYIGGAGITRQPIRAAGTGLRRGLTFMLKTNLSDLDYSCRITHGFKVSLTNPSDIPEIDNRFYYLPVSGLTLMSVQPKVMDTSEALRTYSPDERHCFFPTERKLAYFSTYTQSNCDLECLTNFTLRRCNCVEYYMPRNKTTSVCNVGSTSCVYQAEGALNREFIREKVKKIKAENNCNCLPSCITIDYKAEISQSSVEINEVLNAVEPEPEKYQNISGNFLYIFFKDSEFIAMKRGELYGYADFIANCGGLLGLSCGFSVLSLAELIYHFTLRLWNNNKRREEVMDQRNVLSNQLQKNPAAIWTNKFLY